jgi:hypothetical protein
VLTPQVESVRCASFDKSAMRSHIDAKNPRRVCIGICQIAKNACAAIVSLIRI